MKCVSTFFTTLFVFSTGWVLPHPVAYAVKTDGTISFAQPPLLISATTPYTDTNVWDTTYYFTLELPVNAGEPLQRVTFSQTEGTERIRFDLKHSGAFEGTRDRRGPKLTLKPPAKSDLAEARYLPVVARQTQPVTVTFDPPVPPGKTVTIGLRTVRNPLYDGVYLFSVTAFPAGEQAAGQFLGFGRLQFYTDGNSD